MFPMFWTVSVAVLFSVLRVHGMPIDETEIPRSPSDRDNYKEEREVRSASTFMPMTDILLKVTTEMPKGVPSELREEVSSTTSSSSSSTSTTSSPALGSTKSASKRAKDISSKIRRDAFLPLQQAFWTQSPSEASPYNYDGYLGKVRRDAPIPLFTSTSSSPRTTESVKVY